MASTNFLVFDEGKQNMMSDGDYSANTQRARGVTPGIAYPNLHNKLYYQVSVMAKAIADFIVAQGANASDEDVEQLTADISTAFTNFVDKQAKEKYLPLSGGTLKGSLGVQDVLMVQKNGEDQPKLTIDDGKHRVDFIIDTNGEARFLNESQEFVSIYAKNLHGTADKAVADKNGREIDTGYLKTDGGTLKGSLGVQDVLMVQKNGEDQPKLTLDDGSHRADFILDVNSEVQLLNESQEPVSLTVADLHGTADKAVADKNGREIDTGYLKTDGGTLTGSLGVQDVLMVQKQTAQPKINLTDGTHSLNIILDENGDVRFIDNSGKTLNIFVKQVIQG